MFVPSLQGTHIVVGCVFQLAGLEGGSHDDQQVLASNCHVWVREMSPKVLHCTQLLLGSCNHCHPCADFRAWCEQLYQVK
jgi:hypothetical protein